MNRSQKINMPFTGKKEGGKTKRKVDARCEEGENSKPVEQRLLWEKWEVAEARSFHTKLNPPWVGSFFSSICLWCSLHRYASDYEKIIAAAAEFASGRVWPVNFPRYSGPKFIWEKV